MPAGFDWIAPYYDSIARLVFGSSIRRCQLQYLDRIPMASKVLILGGGTGWILTELLKINPTCKVWYVEASGKMLEKAMTTTKAPPTAQVFFIHGTEKDLGKIADVRFDAVITNFYFDLFTPTVLKSALDHITHSLNLGAKMLVSEFVQEKRWQRMLLFVMYRFFKWTCAVEASKLPGWQDQLMKHGFTERDSTMFYGRFMKSALYVFEGRLQAVSARL